jgi:hypothetical protein
MPALIASLLNFFKERHITGRFDGPDYIVASNWGLMHDHLDIESTNLDTARGLSCK